MPSNTYNIGILFIYYKVISWIPKLSSFIQILRFKNHFRLLLLFSHLSFGLLSSYHLSMHSVLPDILCGVLGNDQHVGICPSISSLPENENFIIKILFAWLICCLLITDLQCYWAMVYWNSLPFRKFRPSTAETQCYWVDDWKVNCIYE